MKKVIVVKASTGGGHNKVAQTIKAKLLSEILCSRSSVYYFSYGWQYGLESDGSSGR